MPKDKEAEGKGKAGKAGTKQQKAEKEKPAAATGQQNPKPRGRAFWAGIFIIIIMFAIAGGLVYGLNRGAPASFSTFQSNFNSAPRVAIFVTANNGTQLAATVGCATSVIQQIVASKTTHRNASTIDFYVMNATSCVYSPTGIGGQLQNYTYSTPGRCINVSTKEPSLFINYTDANTTIIKSTSLVIEGNYRFLLQCAVASEMAST